MLGFDLERDTKGMTIQQMLDYLHIREEARMAAEKGAKETAQKAEGK